MEWLELSGLQCQRIFGLGSCWNCQEMGPRQVINIVIKRFCFVQRRILWLSQAATLNRRKCKSNCPGRQHGVEILTRWPQRISTRVSEFLRKMSNAPIHYLMNIGHSTWIGWDSRLKCSGWRFDWVFAKQTWLRVHLHRWLLDGDGAFREWKSSTGQWKIPQRDC